MPGLETKQGTDTASVTGRGRSDSRFYSMEMMHCDYGFKLKIHVESTTDRKSVQDAFVLFESRLNGVFLELPNKN